MLTLVGTYPPIRCGIATFNRDLREALLREGVPSQVAVVAHPEEVALPFPQEVVRVVAKEDREGYRALARLLRGPVILQHEYGLYGGKWGDYVLDLRGPRPQAGGPPHPPPGPASRARRGGPPLHAGPSPGHGREGPGLRRPPPGREGLLRALGVRIPVAHIPHGVPDLPRPPKEALKRALGLEGAFLLFTYGLLGPGKGLEFALKVLARVLPHNPRVRYLVAGRLHPNLERHEGRRYLERVREMAEALGVGEAFLLREGYLSEEELYRLAGAADLFLLPYPNLEQVSSGTLSYALALGKAVLSTPFRHARAALAAGRGVLLPLEEEAWAQAVLALAESPERLREMEERAYAYARDFTWPRVARAYRRLLEEVADVRPRVA